MHIRNSIIVLEKLTPYFPTVDFQGRVIRDRIANIISNDKREDLRIRAVGYHALLKKTEKTWISMPEFRGVSIQTYEVQVCLKNV